MILWRIQSNRSDEFQAMPIFSIQIDEKTTDAPPATLPVYHNDRKVALAAFDETNYSFNLPHSLSYLVQMGFAVPTLIYDRPGETSSDLASITLVYRPQKAEIVKRFTGSKSLRV